MWVFCCGMRRAGSTLQYQLTAEIIESQGVGRPLGWVRPQQIPQLQADYGAKEGFLVVKCHSYIEEATELFSRGEAKAIYVYRDIRDVVVSGMNKNKKSFWQVISSGFIRMILKEYYKWNSVDDILVSKYETMVADLRQEVLRIADYLGVNLDDSLVDRLSEKYAVDKQKRRIQSFDYESHGVRDGRSVYDPISLLHRDHIHSGKSEQWKTALSHFQVGLLENMAYDWLVDRDYPISQNWVNRKAAAIGYLFYRVPRYTKKRIKKLMSY